MPRLKPQSPHLSSTGARAPQERQRERRRRRAAKKSAEIEQLRRRIRASERVVVVAGGDGGDGGGGGGQDGGVGPGGLKVWQQKLRDRWERPIDRHTGKEVRDPEILAALKAKLRARQVADARAAAVEAASADGESVASEEGGNAGRPSAALAQYRYGTGDLSDSEEGEEQELFRVVRGVDYSAGPASSGNWKLSRVVKLKTKGKAASDPRVVKNQRMVDALASLEHGHDSDAAGSAEARPGAAGGADSVSGAGEGTAEAGVNLSLPQFPLTKEGYPDDSKWRRGRATRDIRVAMFAGSGGTTVIPRGTIIVMAPQARKGGLMQGYPEGRPHELGTFMPSEIALTVRAMENVELLGAEEVGGSLEFTEAATRGSEQTEVEARDDGGRAAEMHVEEPDVEAGGSRAASRSPSTAGSALSEQHGQQGGGEQACVRRRSWRRRW
eukprot:COSAG01_NODE_7597_length_3113_cov_5.019776_2_plen_441_part_00